jgi:hypothetical protein
VFPGCRMPAVACDLDHTIPWSESGPTESTNLAPACRHDHSTRHRIGWTYRPLPDGDYHLDQPPRAHLHHKRQASLIVRARSRPAGHRSR